MAGLKVNPNMKRFCIKCGTEINDDQQVFCLVCGEKLVPVTEHEQQSGSLKESGKASGKKENNKNRAVGIIAALIILAAIGCGIFYFMGKRPAVIDLDKYISGTIDGFNGYGSVEYDYETFQQDVLDMMTKKHTLQDNGDGMAWEAAGLAIYSYFDDEIIFDGGKEDGALSNGDTFHMDYEYDEEWWKDHGIKFTGGNKTYTVSGLKEVEEFDAFENESKEEA